MGKLNIRSKLDHNLQLRIGGQGEDKEVIIEEFNLAPKSTVRTKNEFFTVLFVQTNAFAGGEISVQSNKIPEPEQIKENDWGNIWLYDGVVYFTGYITKREFKTQAVVLPRFFKGCK